MEMGMGGGGGDYGTIFQSYLIYGSWVGELVPERV